jgi:hypothetical protein
MIYFIAYTPSPFLASILVERVVANRAPTFQARREIRSQVIAKSAGSEEPVFTPMDALPMDRIAWSRTMEKLVHSH